jgi:hypothetical protein
MRSIVVIWGLLVAVGLWLGPSDATAASKQRAPAARKPPVAEETARRYVQAVAAGGKAAAGRLDFACAYRLVSAGSTPPASFPPDNDPLYGTCWEPIANAHAAAIEQKDQGVDTLWPGKGSLVFFAEDFTHYAPSCFVMEALGASPPAGGLVVEVLDSKPIPRASFPLGENGRAVAAKATLVRMRIGYRDPLLSPASYAPGAYQWTSTVPRPRQALKTVTLKWIVLSGLKKAGFPADVAVVNLPAREASATEQAVPFTAETSGYEPDSARWWQPGDAPGVLIAAVGRASLFPEWRDRLGLLNRVLIIDPSQLEALTLLTRDLYQAVLNLGGAAHKVPVKDPALATVFNELYWNTYAQTTRTDLSLGMEMGGLAQPTAADFLYRMIPAMRRLADVHPQDFENRLRLGNAYRWNADQLAAIELHEGLLKEIPPQRTAARARVLAELAWSRIAKVAWNRTFDDPGILQAYEEAEEAARLADQPLDRFVAAYTMAYSLLFMPQRDNKLILERLTEAMALYRDLPGASPASWTYLLSHESLKMVLDADPIFTPLLDAS